MNYVHIDKLNKVVDKLPENLRPFFFKKPVEISTRRIELVYEEPRPERKVPKPVSDIIEKLRLLDEPDYNNRALMVIGYMRQQNYAINTAKQYFGILKSLKLFGDNCPIKPKPLEFEGKAQTRLVSDHDYKLVLDLLLEKISPENIPIILAMFTGLRAMEVLQFTNQTLYELSIQSKYVSVRRKQTTKFRVSRDQQTRKRRANNDPEYIEALDPSVSEPQEYTVNWIPVYTTHLKEFVKFISTDFYRLEFEKYTQDRLIIPLFKCTTQTLTNRFKAYFVMATNQQPPLGFGVHVCRTMSAILLSNSSDNIKLIQQFLQHRSAKVTEVYLKRDPRRVTEGFNKYTTDAFKDFTNILKAPQIEEQMQTREAETRERESQYKRLEINPSTYAKMQFAEKTEERRVDRLGEKKRIRDSFNSKKNKK